MKLENTAQKPAAALLVSVCTGKYDTESSLDELAELTQSAGAIPKGFITQNLNSPETSTYVGSGKLQEIKEFCQNEEIELLIFDSELSPVQIRNIETETDVRVIDRTMLILDIFALRAKSKEGKLQVELAQLKYMLPRLTGKGIRMSRLGGGIGTRGPGETQLETDRRHIRRKMENIKEQLAYVSRHRNALRKRREKDGVITVVMVGYTNAGKSTLMNKLTDAGVLAEDKLFATLDPASRALKLPNGMTVMLIDTVGFIRRLPHHLIEAFKSTLEEAVFADVILNICDISNPEAKLHLDISQELLVQLGCTDIPVISVWNKCDLTETIIFENISNNSVKISAKTGFGIDHLLSVIEQNLAVQIRNAEVLLPFGQAGLINQIRESGALISEEYTAEGIKASVAADARLWPKIKEYAI